MLSVNRLPVVLLGVFWVFWGLQGTVYSQVIRDESLEDPNVWHKEESGRHLSKGGYVSILQTSRRDFFSLDVWSWDNGHQEVPLWGSFFRCEIGFRIESRSRDDGSGAPDWSLFLGIPFSHMGSQASSLYIGGQPISSITASVKELGFGPSMRFAQRVHPSLYLNLGIILEKIQGTVSYSAFLSGYGTRGKYSSSLEFAGQRAIPSLGIGFFAGEDFEFQVAREFHSLSLEGLNSDDNLIPFDGGHYRSISKIESPNNVGCWSFKVTALF